MSSQEQVAAVVDKYLERRRTKHSHAATGSRAIAAKATQKLGFEVTIQDVNQVLRVHEQAGRIRLSEPMNDGSLSVTFQ